MTSQLRFFNDDRPPELRDGNPPPMTQSRLIRELEWLAVKYERIEPTPGDPLSSTTIARSLRRASQDLADEARHLAERTRGE